LTARARQVVADTSGWDKNYGYYWTSNTEVLYFLPQAGVVAGHRNILAGREKPQEIEEQWCDPWQVIVSPDGRWVYWSKMVVNTGPPATEFCTIDGRRCANPAPWDYNGWAWMPDSRHWVEFVDKSGTGRGAYALVHDVLSRRKGNVKRLPIAAGCPLEGYAEMFTPDGRFLIATLPSPAAREMGACAMAVGRFLDI
jgi:hypothetical protein